MIMNGYRLVMVILLMPLTSTHQRRPRLYAYVTKSNGADAGNLECHIFQVFSIVFNSFGRTRSSISERVHPEP
jgi:hypothetical protein